MKISVFIPCIPEHFIFLDRVVRYYNSGSVKPDEIIIVLSDCFKVRKEYIDVFLSYNPNVTLVHTENQLLHTGEACNLSKKLCSGDIIVIQAADDLPHPLRIEIVKMYFERYDIVSLNHSYFGKSHIDYYGYDVLYKMAEKRLSDIKVVQPFEIFKHVTEKPDDVYGQFCNFPVAAGTICHRKEILEDMQWSSVKHGQDTIFCKEIIKRYKKSIIISAPLYFYNK
jgi:hypothetical protein